MKGLIPQSFIDEVLNRTDIVDFIDGFVPLKKRGTSHLACCPFHSESNPSFNVVAKKQFYHCFGCGASGNVISFAMNYLHLSFPDAIETLATRAGLTVPRESTPDKTNHTQSLYQHLTHVTQFYQKTLKNKGEIAIHYLKQRQINGEIAKHYQLGYAPSGWHTLETTFKQNRQELIATGMLIQKEDGTTYDRYRQRIMFPIHDRQGRIIGFGGRAIEPDQKPKYLNSPETIIFQKNRELYGLHQVIQQHKTHSHILVVEGYMDVIALAQHGITNAVATLGTATSTYHVQLLSKHTRQIIFCFDGDNAGRTAAWRALENSLPQLNTGLNASFIFLPDGHDPDSLVRTEGCDVFNKRLEHATPLNQFFWNTLTQDIDYSTHAGKSQLIQAAKPYLIKIPEGAYKQLLIDELARLTRIESHRLSTILTEHLSEKAPHPVVANITRTPLRVATALLLQHPELYAECSDHVHLDLLNDKNQTVLKQIITTVSKHPGINTASLVEAWRDTPMFDAINKLAAWSHQVPHDALVKEFLDTMVFLTKQNQDQTIQQLINKSRHQGLTPTEQHTLQDLLKKRHQHNQ